jgi:hypothetical protein
MLTKKQKNMIKKEIMHNIRYKDCITPWPHRCPFDEISGNDCDDCNRYRRSLKVIDTKKNERE